MGALIRTIFFTLLCLLSGWSAYADTLQVIKTIPVPARLMTVDELGNVYVVRRDNTLLRYTEAGDSSAFYRNNQNGNIEAIDAINPLRLILYYPDYTKVEILDRMLSLKNEINLSQMGLAHPPAVASSADGNLWVYDQFNARLRKIDDQLTEIGQSNDLRQQIQVVPQPSFMVERERKVYVCDTTEGILVFDQYGSYINTLSIFGVKYLQVYGTQLVYRREDSLFSYNLQSLRTNTIILPKNGTVINAAIARHNLYVLYNDRLVLYRLPEEK